MGDELTVDVASEPAGTVVRLKGEVGIAGSSLLERAMTRLLATKPKMVVLDFTEVEMIGSLGMGQLVSAKRSVERGGGKMRLAGVNPNVMGSLRHTRLDGVFQCFATVADAFAAV